MLTGLSLIAVFALVFLNGFFVAAEFALVSVRKSRIEQLINEGNRAAKGVLDALSHLDTYIAATQLGITMASLALGAVGEPTLAHLFEPLFKRFLPEEGATFTSHGVAMVLAFTLATMLHIVLGELAPKSIALQRPDVTSLVVTAPLNIFLAIFRPFILLMNAVGNGVVRLFGLQPVGEHGAVHSVEELVLLVRSTREAGLLEEKQEEMVEGVFDLHETIVRKVMTPRTDMIAVPVTSSLEEIVALHLEHKRTRLPVYEDSVDNVIGTIHLLDTVSLMQMPNGGDLRAILHAPYFVPETKPAADLLSDMQRQHLQMAFVQDEYGTIAGLVTLEDLVEEITGEIQDEYENETPPVQQIDEDTFLIVGNRTLDDMNDQFNAHLPADETDTLGGFLFSQLGRPPRKGDVVEWGPLRMEVDSLQGQRIHLVRVRRIGESAT